MRALFQRSGPSVLLLAGVAQVPIAELAKLAPGSSLERFGESVSIQGERALVGAPTTADEGSAWVFERSRSGEWILRAELRALDGEKRAGFGRSVSLDGDIAVVGAPQDDGPLLADRGAAYVFERQATGAWIEVAELLASDGSEDDLFGASVSLDGAALLVSAPLDDPTGVQSGSAYVFERQGAGAWIEVAKLSSVAGGVHQELGRLVALSGGRALLRGRCSTSCSSTARAHVFERQASGSWLETAELLPEHGSLNDDFGSALALEGERALVGASRDDTQGTDAGAAYVFEREPGGLWLEVARLTGSAGGPGAAFGSALALDGDRAAIGAPGQGTGVVYWFERAPGGAWQERGRMASSSPSSGPSAFGKEVALSGERVLAGDPLDGASGLQAGAALLFDLLPLSGDGTEVSISASGTRVLELDAGHLHAGERYLLVGSLSGTEPGILLPGGWLLPLNPDSYWKRTLELPNHQPLSGSLGRLNAFGHAEAGFSVAPSDLGLVDRTVHHAFVTLGRVMPRSEGAGPQASSATFASNAFPLVFVR